MSLQLQEKGLWSTLKSKVKQWIPVLKTVTVEPAAFLMMGGCLMSYLVYLNLIMDKICRVDLKYDDDVCTAIAKLNSTFSTEETEIQKIAADIRTHRSLIDHSVTILYILLIGTWSDTHGRKIPMLIGISSFILQPLALLICAYMEHLDGRWTGYIASISRSLGGGELIYTMAAYSYISNTTDKSTRTIRIGLLSAGYTLGVPFGFAMGGAVSRAKLGFVTSFAIAAFFPLVAFFIVLFTVGRNTLGDGDKSVKIVEEDERDRNFCKKVVISSRDKVQEFFVILLKERENLGRLKVWLLLAVHTCVAAPIHGEFGVMYFFLRGRLGWDAGDYGYFATYNTFCGVVGVVMSVGVLSYLLKISDPVIGFIAGISQFGGCIIYACAYSAAVMYLAPAVDMMNGTMAVISRAMMSKIVLPDEIGTVFSIVAVIDSVVPLAMDPTYSTLYRLTVEIFSGYFWILSAAFTVPPQIIYTWLIWDSRSKKSENCSRDLEKCVKGIINPAFSSDNVNIPTVE